MAGTRQIALLRGINLGRRSVGMAELRTALEDRGHEDVRTLLRSGNVVLTSPETGAALERRLERELTEAFGFAIPVVVRTREELAETIARNPLGDVADNPSRYTVTFFSAPVPDARVRELERLAVPPEALAAAGRELYTWHPDGLARSALAAELARKRAGATGTNRNWNTVTKLLALAEGD
ncbi:MAG TPA: DUF1697 domain-containing protein [Gaiellaceae bacterium]|jgi:uncharacterized protein (DUF1697 family)|nr:DUF1697 domain-containing protein [Gaiellaceae bacterium]